MNKALSDPIKLTRPPFSETIQICIEQIREDFHEHFPLTFDEWAEGFRSDENPAQQIAVWHYAGSIYRYFANDEPCEHCRADLFKCIVACMTSRRESVSAVYHPVAITREAAERVLDRYFARPAVNQIDAPTIRIIGRGKTVYRRWSVLKASLR